MSMPRPTASNSTNVNKMEGEGRDLSALSSKAAKESGEEGNESLLSAKPSKGMLTKATKAEAEELPSSKAMKCSRGRDNQD